jgi:hypothetical protein
VWNSEGAPFILDLWLWMEEVHVLEMKIEEVITNGAQLLLHVYFVGFNCESLLPHSLFVAKFFRKIDPMMIP